MLEIFNDNNNLIDENHKSFNNFTKRCPSFEQFLPFTELTVNFTNEVIERDLGRIDMFAASDFLSKREISPEVMITALMYVSRYKRRKDSGECCRMLDSSITSADLFIVSMMLASKYLFDDGIEENVINEEWADDFGIETKEMNDLEVDFLTSMDWQLFVRTAEYNSFKDIVGKCVTYNLWSSHNRRGSTYLELDKLSNGTTDQLYEMLRLLCKVICGCTLVYLGALVSVHLVVVASPALLNGPRHPPQIATLSHIDTTSPISDNGTKTHSVAFTKEINESYWDHHDGDPRLAIKDLQMHHLVV